MPSYNTMRIRALETYYADPKVCKECGKVIKVKEGEPPSQARKRSFCNTSCSAIFNNKNRIRGKRASRQQDIVEQLGMPLGTAQNRLRRNIMFMLMEETDRNKCFRCGLPMTVEDFSIEHKEPWLGSDAALFWSLDNISFSHLKCNCKHSRSPATIAKVDGKGWCGRCRQYLDEKEFPDRKFDMTRPNKERSSVYCRQCRNSINYEWRNNSTTSAGRKKI